MWISDHVLPQRDLHFRPRHRNGSKTPGFDAARPIVDPNIGFVRGFASIRDWVVAFHGGIREGQGVPRVFRERVRFAARFDGGLEVLF